MATFTTTYAGWTTAAPSTGDLIVVLVLAATSAKTFTCTDGTWTIPASNSKRQPTAFTLCIAYHDLHHRGYRADIHLATGTASTPT